MNERGNVTVLMWSRFLFWRERCLLIFVFAKQITPLVFSIYSLHGLHLGCNLATFLPKYRKRTDWCFDTEVEHT